MLSLIHLVLLLLVAGQHVSSNTLSSTNSKFSQTAFLGSYSPLTSHSPSSSALSAKASIHQDEQNRRSFLSSLTVAIAVTSSTPSNAAESSESFTTIAERASKISKSIEANEEESSTTPTPTIKAKKRTKIDTRTAYDFELPVEGRLVSFRDLIGQEFRTVDEVVGKNADGEDEVEKVVIPKVKAILVSNLKQDDPVARKDIAEFISLAARFGKRGEFVVVCSPTDQGYYEPDTSALIRLKLSTEYGYGINPATIVTDKMNFLGTGADQFWRWLEGTCRTPEGLGRIQANFEKFLIDGKTGLPLRRYPRKYAPFDIADDIESILQDKPLPPAGSNWKEEWRVAMSDADRDTYRFQKGLNWFDQ